MDDLISRQAAIDALGEEPEVWQGNDEYAQGLNNQWHYDVNAIKAVPAAQPDLSGYSERLWKAAYERGKQEAQSERKMGRWIGYNTDKEGWMRTDGSPVFMSCSECHGTVLNNGSAHWNFCPNCGADMRGEQDG